MVSHKNTIQMMYGNQFWKHIHEVLLWKWFCFDYEIWLWTTIKYNDMHSNSFQISIKYNNKNNKKKNCFKKNEGLFITIIIFIIFSCFKGLRAKQRKLLKSCRRESEERIWKTYTLSMLMIIFFFDKIISFFRIDC